jgi:ubiquinone/menaquinone biosynthesis C-methylase UbiE
MMSGDAAASPNAGDPQLEMRRTPDGQQPPAFDRGWRRTDGGVDPFLSYTTDDPVVNWSVELEELHQEASREHFLDVWTRQSLLAGLGQLPASPVIVDLGCSSGYMLEDLYAAYPGSLLVGIDLVASGLRNAHHAVPEARLIQADACALPLESASVDALVSANLLEHVPDDRGALAELRRVLRPGGRGALVVPFGPSTYDYYDRFLGHERRYGRGELRAKAMQAGLEVISNGYLGSLLYPAFWLVKQRNRRAYEQLRAEALAARVANDIARTRTSRIAQLTARVERRLSALGMTLPFGIRCLTVVRRPDDDG